MIPATGVRRPWADIPAALRDELTAWLGSPIVEAVTQPNGFSPGVAVRIACADGRRVFVKAVGTAPNPHAIAYHRREARMLRALSPDAPVAHLLLALDAHDWCVLVLEDVAGRHPHQPWQAGDLDRVLAAMATLAALPAPTATRAGDVLRKTIHGFAQAPPDRLDAWTRANLDTLIALERAAPDAAAGTACVHFDLRADNVLLTDDRVVVLDWAHAAAGAPWLDLVCLAPSVAMQGGPAPEELARRYAPPLGTADEVTAVLASVAGFFTAQALAPPPPGLPTLRPFQAAQGDVARAWLARRL